MTRESAVGRHSTCIDLAGGRSGGAGRFRQQYLQYAADGPRPGVTAIGGDSRLTARWTIEREFLARGFRKVVATNNLGFRGAGRIKWTMLRNANHFLTPIEWESSRNLLSKAFPAQVALVRSACNSSDALIVPSTSMAERVARLLPSAASRLTVRFHPLSAPTSQRRCVDGDWTILCPIVDSPFKRMSYHLERLQSALGSRRDVRVICTTDPSDMPMDVRSDSRFDFRGVVPRSEIEQLYETITAIYYPTTVESFGYPLAEARSRGIPVIAQESSHNAEIAAQSLCSYRESDDASLGSAVEEAFHHTVAPDPGPFNVRDYFEWMTA